MTIFGVDVSEHQGAIDWSAVKADGITFAICRASIGTVLDTEYAAKVAGARRAGLIAGAYHFTHPSDTLDPADACDRFLSQVGNLEGMLIGLDVEKQPEGATDAEVYARTRAWVNHFRSRTTHPLLLYSGRWFWKDAIGDPPGAWIGPLWDSHYVSRILATPYRTLWDATPLSWWTPGYGGWTRATMLQFTSSGKVDGYSGKLDVSAYLGTLAQLHALTISPIDNEPDVIGGPDVAITRIKGEDFVPAASGRLYSRPSVSAPMVADVPSGAIVRSIGELPGESGGNWRVTEYADKPAYFRVETGPGSPGFTPFVPAGSPTAVIVDQRLTDYLARRDPTPRDCTAEVAAAVSSEYTRVTEGANVQITFPDAPA